MKKTKKFFALLLMLSLILSYSISVFAVTNEDADPAKITIQNASIGEEYSIYKVFDVTFNTEATVDGQPGTSAIYMTNNADLLALLPSVSDTDAMEKAVKAYKDATEDSSKAPVCPFYKGTAVEGKEGFYYVYHLWTNDSTITSDAAGRGWLLKNLDKWTSAPTDTKTAASDKLEFGGVAKGETGYIDYGYYLITTTNGSEVTVNSTTPAAVVKDKNTKTPSGPTKVEDKVTTFVGDTVTFTTTLNNATNYVTQGSGETMVINPIISYNLTDTWEAGLKFDPAKSIQSVTLTETDTRLKVDTDKGQIYVDSEGTEYYMSDPGKAADPDAEPPVEYVAPTYKALEDDEVYTGNETLVKATEEYTKFEQTLNANDNPGKNQYKLTYVDGALTWKIDIPWGETETIEGTNKVKLKDHYYNDGCTITVVYTLDVTDAILKNKTSEFKADNDIVYAYKNVTQEGSVPADGGGKTHVKTTVYTFGFSIRKFDKQSHLLNGAKFLLYKEVPKTHKVGEIEYPLYEETSGANPAQYYLKDGKYISVADDTTEYNGTPATGLKEVTEQKYYQMNTQATYYYETDKANYPVFEERKTKSDGKEVDQPDFLFKKTVKDEQTQQDVDHYYYVSDPTKEYEGEDELVPVIGVYYPTNENLSLSESGNSYVIKWVDRENATWLLADDSYDTMEACGLDVGKYFLEEVEAPYGFIPPSAPFPVEISVKTKGNETTGADYTFDITIDETVNGQAATDEDEFEKTSDSKAYETFSITNGENKEMPTTGGAGTIALISCGAVAFMAAAIVLVTKKRLYNEGM